MVTHTGEQAPVMQVLPMSHELPQPSQLSESVRTSTHCDPQSTSGAAHVGFTHWLPLHTLPVRQSPLPQHSKQPWPAQQWPLPAHSALKTHRPALHVSEVQEFPSLHWA